jgi:hypothetical protein
MHVLGIDDCRNVIDSLTSKAIPLEDLMRNALLIVILCCGLLCASSTSPSPSDTTGSGCAIVLHALQSYQRIKPGVTRQEVEHDFESVGLAFRGEGVFVYKGCRYIQVKITFTEDSSMQGKFSPKDRVSSVSQLFVDYAVAD